MKQVLITGAGGFVGTALTKALTSDGCVVAPLRRGVSMGAEANAWVIENRWIQFSEPARFDAVIHLAGENIASGRWTADRKKRIRNSRIKGTRLLCEHLAGLSCKPAVLLSASASGFYGDRGEEILAEESTRGDGFLSEVCEAWEEATAPAIAGGIRVVNMRFSMVLSREGGALAKMLPIFRLGLGGRLGDGGQCWSWIDLRDLTDAVKFCIRNEAISGPVNFGSPNPVTNREFTSALGSALHRPTILPVPKFALRLALGEMADGLLFASARMQPRKLLDAGFEFRLGKIEEALSEG